MIDAMVIGQLAASSGVSVRTLRFSVRTLRFSVRTLRFSVRTLRFSVRTLRFSEDRVCVAERIEAFTDRRAGR